MLIKKAPGILYLPLLLSTKMIANNHHTCSTNTRLASISPVTRRQLHHLQQLYIRTLFTEKVKVELLNHKKSDRRIIMQPG
jgi:hypothetical protein